MSRRGLSKRFSAADGAAFDAVRALERRIRPDFRKAVVAFVLAVAALVAGHILGGPHAHRLHTRIAVYCCAAAMVLLGILATRLFAAELARVGDVRAGAAAGTPLRLFALLIGYAAVLLSTLDLLNVPIEHLLVGGAVTGVVLGIAAQQSLGNLFAGLVLLFARPFVPGERIVVRSGGLGGPFEGTVTAVGLLYTTVDIDVTTVNLPNSGLLASAVGPAPARPSATAGGDDPLGPPPVGPAQPHASDPPNTAGVSNELPPQTGEFSPLGT